MTITTLEMSAPVDPITLEEIPGERLISYQNGNRSFHFDLQSLYRYVRTTGQYINPETRDPLPIELLQGLEDYGVQQTVTVTIVDHQTVTFEGYQTIGELILEALGSLELPLAEAIFCYDVCDSKQSLYEYDLEDTLWEVYSPVEHSKGGVTVTCSPFRALQEGPSTLSGEDRYLSKLLQFTQRRSGHLYVTLTEGLKRYFGVPRTEFSCPVRSGDTVGEVILRILSELPGQQHLCLVTEMGEPLHSMDLDCPMSEVVPLQTSIYYLPFATPWEEVSAWLSLSSYVCVQNLRSYRPLLGLPPVDWFFKAVTKALPVTDPLTICQIFGRISPEDLHSSGENSSPFREVSLLGSEGSSLESGPSERLLGSGTVFRPDTSAWLWALERSIPLEDLHFSGENPRPFREVSLLGSEGSSLENETSEGSLSSGTVFRPDTSAWLWALEQSISNPVLFRYLVPRIIFRYTGLWEWSIDPTTLRELTVEILTRANLEQVDLWFRKIHTPAVLRGLDLGDLVQKRMVELPSEPEDQRRAILWRAYQGLTDTSTALDLSVVEILEGRLPRDTLARWSLVILLQASPTQLGMILRGNLSWPITTVLRLAVHSKAVNGLQAVIINRRPTNGELLQLFEQLNIADLIWLWEQLRKFFPVIKLVTVYSRIMDLQHLLPVLYHCPNSRKLHDDTPFYNWTLSSETITAVILRFRSEMRSEHIPTRAIRTVIAILISSKKWKLWLPLVDDLLAKGRLLPEEFTAELDRQYDSETMEQFLLDHLQFL